MGHRAEKRVFQGSQGPEDYDLNAMNGSRPRDDGRVFLKEVAYGPENGVPSNSGFVDGIAENVRVSSILLDPGSMVDVVNLTFVERNNIPRVRMKEPMAIRMADSLVIFYC